MLASVRLIDNGAPIDHDSLLPSRVLGGPLRHIKASEELQGPSLLCDSGLNAFDVLQRQS